MRTSLQPDRRLIGTIMVSLSLTAAANAIVPGGQELLETLRTSDAALFEGFTLSMSLKTPPSHRHLEFERAQEQCTITADNVRRGLLKHGTYVQPLRYHAAGVLDFEPIEYDAHGNLYVSRPEQTYLLKTPQINDVYTRHVTTVLSPADHVVREEEYEKLARYRPSDDQNLYEFERILLVAGRGFFKHIERITDTDSMPDGTIRALASGSYGAGMNGTWELTIEAKNGNMVRSAKFRYQDKVLFTSESFGTKWFNGFAIPETGRLIYYLSGDRQFRVDIDFERFEREVDGALIESLSRRVKAKLAPDSVIMNYRPDPRRPVTSTVGAN